MDDYKQDPLRQDTTFWITNLNFEIGLAVCHAAVSLARVVRNISSEGKQNSSETDVE
jgi:hypothetical protein